MCRPQLTNTDENGKPKPIARGLPVVRAHVDYTLNSGRERLKVLLPDEWEKLQKTPYAVIQVHTSCTDTSTDILVPWLTGPVHQTGL